MKKITLLLLISVFALSSCRKKEVLPAETTGEPVFYLRGTFNDLPLEVKAGDEGYYMHTSVYQDENNIYVFKGDLNSDCSAGCGYSLSVLFNDTKVSEPGAPVDIATALQAGTYNFLSRNDYPTTQVVTFTPKTPFENNSTYAWQISDSTGVVASSTSYTCAFALKLGRDYTVKYSYEDASGVCLGSHSSVIHPGSIFKTWMTTNKTDNIVSFSAVTDKTGEYSYSWDFGDGSTGLGKTISHTYKSNGKYTVKLSTTDANNNTSVCMYEVNTNPAGCENNFISKFSPLDFSKILKTITVIVREPSGKLYSSAEVELNGTKSAEVIGVEDYLPNADGKPTKRLHLRLSCDLKGPDGQIKLEDADAYIGVAY